MATNTEPHALVAHWIATAKTQEMVEQYIAALEYNVRDCNKLHDALRGETFLWHKEHGILLEHEITARYNEAMANLELAQKRLAEMSSK